MGNVMKQWKTLLVSASLVMPIVMATGTAQAGSNESARVRYDFKVASSDFTDCPTPAIETVCLGTGVRVTQIKSKVGEMESKATTIDVNVVEVHLHADGTFEIGALVTSGSGSGRLELEDLRSAKVRGSVAMSDGSTAVVRFSLTATGPVSPYSGSATVDEPGCPSGSADIAYSGKSTEAVATGQLTIGTDIQVPTVAAGPAFMLTERDKGACTPV
jgi:hypothetical protein